MDAERYVRENRDERIKLIKSKKHTKANIADEKINYRLVKTWEVPQWIQDSVADEAENPMQEYGLGKRKRNEVNYKDELSEAQWLKIVEAGGDPQKEMEKRRKRKDEEQQQQAQAPSALQDQDGLIVLDMMKGEPSDDLINSDEEMEEDSEDDFVLKAKKKTA